jgi:hypothetical protein
VYIRKRRKYYHAYNINDYFIAAWQSHACGCARPFGGRIEVDGAAE